ncbi:MAG: hypothetical protein PWP46_1548 [Fusobacteriaceae bacterium]|jgi:hypothetical protein|nr:hypothetical protein [Fusobacteriales bacterium]MDN5304662.1 hypothetical protein [Fusobacteriaceae bacterium]
MKKLNYTLILLITIFQFSFSESESILNKIADYYVPDENQTTLGVFFPYYANETGASLGYFYYDTDFLNRDGKFTNVALYSPSTNIVVDWFNLEDLKLNDTWNLKSKLFYGGAPDFRLYSSGNDSNNEEWSYTNLDGYKEGSATEFNYEIGLSRELSEQNKINFLYIYHYTKVDLDILSYDLVGKTDKLAIEFERSTVKNTANPNNGYRTILGAEKSLNLLSHDSNNDWDYYKLRGDFRTYFPVKNDSVIALRLYTVMFEYLKSVSDTTDAYYNYDTAKLGNLNEFRGYFFYRYKDKNLALYQAEYRFPITNRIKGTVFYEVGRVNDTFNNDLFFKDLHTDGGFGLNYFFNQYVMLRGDIAISSELTQLRASIGNAF